MSVHARAAGVVCGVFAFALASAPAAWSLDAPPAPKPPPVALPPPPTPPPPPRPPPPPPPPSGAYRTTTGATPTTTGAQPGVAADAQPQEPVEPVPPPEPQPFAIVPETVKVAPPPPGVLRPALGLCYPDPCLSPFFRDTDVRLHLRSFWFDRHNVNGTDNEAWALGGWLQYTSGWLGDVFQVGATGYTSQPLYAPEDRDGTLLLRPGQEEITVLGQAWARARWHDYAILTVYRQSINDGYIGPQDNRMIPNTFEAVTVRGKLCNVSYDAGYVWQMKGRNRDDFIPMAEQAGVANGDDGVLFGSVLWTPNDCWEVFGGDYYTPDVFNTFFTYGKHSRPLSGCVDGQFGFQFTQQSSVGDELLGGFDTWNLGVGGRAILTSGWTFGMAAHITGEDAGIRSPYGSWPGWLSLIETDFDRANEKAFGIGVKYDFGKSRRVHVPGLLAILAWARGVERGDASTGGHLPDTDEFDLDVIYDVPTVKGLQFRLRQAWVEAGGPDTGYQVRFIVNWEIDLL